MTVLVEARYRVQAQPAGLVRALERLIGPVAVVDAEDLPLADASWLVETKLVVARGRSLALLAALTTAETCGVAACNRRAAIGGVHNKADLAAALLAAGMPTPSAWLGPTDELADRIPADMFPVILKPVFGDNGRGLRLVGDAGELANLSWAEPVALAQRWIPNDGRDLKLYAVGDAVWAVRRPSPFGDGTGDVERVTVTDVMAEIAQRCRRLFGLDLFGVDCVETTSGPLVIEVNDFPNYTGVPGADDVMARFVCSLFGRAA